MTRIMILVGLSLAFAPAIASDVRAGAPTPLMTSKTVYVVGIGGMT